MISQVASPRRVHSEALSYEASASLVGALTPLNLRQTAMATSARG